MARGVFPEGNPISVLRKILKSNRIGAMMKRLIPYQIHHQYQRGNFRGSFESASLFVDISGFTRITEALMKQEKDGAEILTEIINNIFNPIVKYVYDHGGMISHFAGDAFTALFPVEDEHIYSHALQTAFFVNQFFREHRSVETKYGDFELGVKVGISCGEVVWGIWGDVSAERDAHLTFFYRGEAVNSCANAEHHAEKGDIIAHKRICSLIQNHCHGDPIDNGYFRLTDCDLDLPPKRSESEQAKRNVTREVLRHFFITNVVALKTRGEFRYVCNLFISIKESNDFQAFNRFVSKTLELVYNYGGYFNRISFGDKGCVMLILFGAPVSYENNIQRAMDFLLALKAETRLEWRAGVTYDMAFAGFMGGDERREYTSMGDKVNVAARFMMKANWGEIWISEAINRKINDYYTVEKVGKFRFKGKSQPIAVFALRGTKRIKATLFEGEMVGRQKELEKIKEYCQPIFAEGFGKAKKRLGGVVYIYGEAGIGKSRLLYELIQDLQETDKDFETAILQTDNILKKPLNPFYSFFNNYFRQAETTVYEEKKALFDRIYEELLDSLPQLLFSQGMNPNDSQLSTDSTMITLDVENLQEIRRELVRVKTIIGAIIGLRWENSVYEKLNPQDRPEATRFAIKEFFKILSLFQPLLVILEDLHWIDDESRKFFEIFTRRISYYPIIIFATARFNDDGSKPVLDLPEETPENQIVMEHLSADKIRNLIEDRLNGACHRFLEDFILERTQGNPFYVEQFCLYLKENELIRRKNGKYGLTELREDIPTGINSVLIARVDRLTYDLKETMQVASVLGREFEVAILSELIELLRSIERDGATHLQDKNIDVLLEKGETERLWHSISELRYLFTQVLLREAVYDMQLRVRLRKLHKLAAESIEKLYGKSESYYPEIAYHYNKAENFIKAKEYYLNAGDYAEELYSSEEALDYYRSALSIANRLDEEILEIATIYNKIGAVYYQKANYDKAMEYYEKALNIRVEEMGEQRPEIAESYNNLGEIYDQKGDYENAIVYHNKALEIQLDTLGTDTKDVGKSYNNLGIVYDNKGELDKAISSFEKSIAIFRNVVGEIHSSTASSYNNIARVYLQKGEYDDAISYYKRAVKIWKEVQDEKHPLIAKTYNNIGAVYYQKGDYNSTISYFEKSLEIKLEILGDKHHDTAYSYNNLGVLYRIKGDNQKAISYYKKALSIYKEILGEKHPETATSYNNIGAVYNAQGDYDDAIFYFEKALFIRSEALGVEHSDTADSYNNVGAMYAKKGDNDKALDFHNKSLDIRLKVYGKDHLLTAKSYNNIGDIYDQKGDYDNALSYYQKALDIRTELLGEQHPDTAESYNNVGSIYAVRGDYARALDYYNRGLDIRLHLFGEEHSSVAKSYNNIGDVYDQKGEYDNALFYHEKALGIQQETLGEQHPDIAETYNYIGVLYDNKGDYPKAIAYYKSALQIFRDVVGEQHMNTASSYNNIATTYFKKCEYDIARTYYQRALDIWKNVVGEKHPKTAKAYNSLGAIYLQKRDYDNAIFNFEKALAIKYNLLGEKHPETATSYNNIGIVYSRKGDYDNAIKYYKKSLDIKIGIFGENHREISVLYNNIGSLFNLTGDYDQAIHYFDKALSINLKALGETHPDSADSYFNLGKTCYQNGDYEKALEMLNRSVSTKMRDSDTLGNAYNYLSLVCIALGKWNQALDYVHESFRYEKRNQNGLNYLCMALILKDSKSGKDEEFLDLLNRITNLTKLDQTPDAYFQKSIDFATEKAIFSETLILALSKYGKYLYQNGKIDEGIQKLRLAKTKAKENVTVYQKDVQRTCNELELNVEEL